MQCPRCNSSVPQEYRFCLECGSDLGAPTIALPSNDAHRMYPSSARIEIPADDRRPEPRTSWWRAAALLAAGGLVAAGIIGGAIVYTNRSETETAGKDLSLQDSLATPSPTKSTQPLLERQTAPETSTATPLADQRLQSPDLAMREPTIHPRALPYVSPQRTGPSTTNQKTPTKPMSESTAGVYNAGEVTTKVRISSKPEPQYTEIARMNQVTGTVILRAIFTADGKVTDIRAVAGLPHGLTGKAIEAARQIKFIPATKDGRAVSMYIQLEYNFNLY